MKVLIGLMITNSMKWSFALILLINSTFTLADSITIQGKTFNHIIIESDKLFSKHCRNISNCFTTPSEIKTNQRQNPLFTLCYQSGGITSIIRLKKEKSKRSVCIKDDYIVDLDSLMGLFKKNTKKN